MSYNITINNSTVTFAAPAPAVLAATSSNQPRKIGRGGWEGQVNSQLMASFNRSRLRTPKKAHMGKFVSEKVHFNIFTKHFLFSLSTYYTSSKGGERDLYVLVYKLYVQYQN